MKVFRWLLQILSLHWMNLHKPMLVSAYTFTCIVRTYIPRPHAPHGVDTLFNAFGRICTLVATCTLKSVSITFYVKLCSDDDLAVVY